MSLSERGKKNTKRSQRPVARVLTVIVALLMVVSIMLAVPAHAETEPTPSSSETQPFETSVIDRRDLNSTSASSIHVLVNKDNPLSPEDYEPKVVALSSVGV